MYNAVWPQADAVMLAMQPLRGTQRLLELALRTGPYGDGFGLQPKA
jgi:hypothetical protein